MDLSAENADQFQGFHSPNMMIVVDEAEGVSDEIYEAIEAVMTAADPLLLRIADDGLSGIIMVAGMQIITGAPGLSGMVDGRR